MLRGENMRFQPAIFIWFVFTQSFFKFHKNGDNRKLILKPGISDCKRIISIDYTMNALEHTKVRLPFFLYTLYNVSVFNVYVETFEIDMRLF